MGKILKDKDDTNGICIYVSPTKALINQVAGKYSILNMNGIID
jgi:replicative superfamily II helicase